MKNINYNKWTFHLSIWIVVVIIVHYYVVTNYNFLTHDWSRFRIVTLCLESIAAILFLGSLVFLGSTLVNNKVKNYQFWIAIFIGICYLIRLVINLVSSVNL
jgi:hypothetical protein